MATKIFGWALLIFGVIIIGWTLYSSYNTFTGKTAAPEIFKIETEKTPIIVQEKSPSTPEAVQKEMEKMIEKQLREVLPIDVLPRMLNLTVWSMLAFILIFGGSQIAGLGVKLLKNQKKEDFDD